MAQISRDSFRLQNSEPGRRIQSLFCTAMLCLFVAAHWNIAQAAESSTGNECEARRLYFGLRGELIVALPNSPPLMQGMLTYRQKAGGVRLYDGYSPIGSISESGELVLSSEGIRGVSDLSCLPKSVKIGSSGAEGELLVPGMVYSAEMSNGDPPQPKNCVGWVVQLFDGSPYMPLQKHPKPRNFLWVVSDSVSIASFIHSGPRSEGALLTIDRDYKISYGDSAREFFKPFDGPRYWPYRFYEYEKEVAISPGVYVGLGGNDDRRRYTTSKNGEPHLSTESNRFFD